MSRKAWLICGAISSLLYVGADLLAAALYPGYHSFTSQAISELAAVGAPTKGLVEPLLIVYDILIIAFGVGVWRSAGRKRALRLVGGLLVGIGVVGLVAMGWKPSDDHIHQSGLDKGQPGRAVAHRASGWIVTPATRATLSCA
jgi:hypothetical membrane protein